MIREHRDTTDCQSRVKESGGDCVRKGVWTLYTNGGKISNLSPPVSKLVGRVQMRRLILNLDL